MKISEEAEQNNKLIGSLVTHNYFYFLDDDLNIGIVLKVEDEFALVYDIRRGLSRYMRKETLRFMA